MRASDIKIGKSYTNGKTTRTVTAFMPHWDNFQTPFVIYKYDRPWREKTHGKMWLPYFAAWAKSTTPEGGEG